MARIYDDRYDEDWRVGPRDFPGYEGNSSNDRNYGAYDPPYWRNRDEDRDLGDWKGYLARRRAWLQSRQDQNAGGGNYWGGREGMRNPQDWETQGEWGTHLNWSRPIRPAGQYAGVGPQGYQRSDERIREDVNDRLTDHPDVDASKIDVQVQHCEVTLTGYVDSRRTKRLAEDIAESVRGVKDVHNQLRVGEMAPAGDAAS